ncbi:MAG: hypothetical protein AAF773_01325 [Cyanobacteria bacterium P01_D01_bin.115]
MTSPTVSFRIEVVDGCALGCLTVPLTQVADWLNFLATPHYRADLVSAEQAGDRLAVYFEASQGLYSYLEGRLMSPLPVAA